MVTIFTNPRPFIGHFDIIQRNAIGSWIRLGCEVILFEDEQKTSSAIASELGVQCITDVMCNQFGTPLLNDVFDRVRERGRNDIIAQVNTDIILMKDFRDAIGLVKDIFHEKPFFMVGRRWDLDIKELVRFNEVGWEEKLLGEIRRNGKRHGLSGIDYWIFRRNFQFDPPSFAVGRPGMDSWLVYRARSLRIPVVDATKAITIVHQNHDYPQRGKDFFEVETQRNLKVAGGFKCMLSLRDADWVLERDGLRRPEFPQRIFSMLSTYYLWRLVLAGKRRLGELLT